jgi:serine/threonine-protein kinase
VAAFCYVCGTATPPGYNMMTGERVAVSRSGVTAVELRTRLQRALGPAYELGQRIGAGGFAEVFRAQDLRLKRSVAVKVLRPDLGLSHGMLERFQREAEVIAALRHPNIVPIFDLGEDSGIAYIIMPFIEGESLRARMEREGALPVAEVRRILGEAAAGLGAAHEAGVIHRDIKPENIMLEGKDARVLLMDFGIAKAVGGDEETPATEEGVAPALTSTGIIVGTPQYMSPEQACGDKTIDARTDQYSLGVVGYRLLSGALPFEGESTRAVLYKQLVSDPPPIIDRAPHAPPALRAAITKAMAKEPRERFDTIADFRTMVLDTSEERVPAAKTAPARPRAAAAAGTAALSAITARASSAVGAVTTAGRRHPRKAALIGGGMVVTAALAALLLRDGGAASRDEFQPISAIGGLDAATTPDSTKGPAPTTANAPATRPPPPAATRGAPPPAGTRRTTPPAGTGRQGATPPPPPSAASTSSCATLVRANNWSDAAAACTTAAEGGDATAMRLLAGMYDRGNGVAQDPVQAVAWYRRAAPNDAEAQFQLSRLYEIGRGTPRDPAANITALREAAARGHQQAILTLASRLEGGAGMNRDYNEAAIWYQRAANAGSATAMLKLADWSSRGRGVTRDEAQGVEWYRRAAEAGSSEGAWMAARAYLEGRGVAANQELGMTLLRQAARAGNPQAAEELRRRGG